MCPRLVVLFLLLAGCGGITPTDCSKMTDTWSGYGATFFSNNCGGCHRQYSTQSGVVNSVGQIEGAISAGRMPRGAGLSATEQNRVLSYLSCGAP